MSKGNITKKVSPTDGIDLPQASELEKLLPLYHSQNQNNSNNESNFRYTLDGFSDRIFTKEQREAYEKNGFIIIKKLLNLKDVAYFYNRIEEIADNVDLRPKELVVMRDITRKDLSGKELDDETKVVKMYNWANEPGLWKFATHRRVKHVVEAFCGDNIRAMNLMAINKPPDYGYLSTRHPFHQDLWYFPFGPADHIVCCWTALQHINRGNGCLAVVPGTHKNRPGGRLLNHGTPKNWDGGPININFHGILDVETIHQIKRNRVHLEMDPGDTVFFHPLLLHASGANLSKHSRRSISVHFASSSLCNWCRFADVAPNQGKELAQMAAQFVGDTLPWIEVWKKKSKQVAGNPGNLKRDGEEFVHYKDNRDGKKDRKRAKL